MEIKVNDEIITGVPILVNTTNIESEDVPKILVEVELDVNKVLTECEKAKVSDFVLRVLG
jgi:hypothetical protein